MLNEYIILMRLLTRSGSPIGAGVDDMLSALGLPEEPGRHILFQRLGALDRRLSEVGLMIRHNPIDHVFYLDTRIRSEQLLEESVLPDRLAATLLVVITLAYQEGGWVSIDRVREFRQKTRRGVRIDLRELAAQRYIEFDDTGTRVRPGTRVGFEIDYESFFRRLVANDS